MLPSSACAPLPCPCSRVQAKLKALVLNDTSLGDEGVAAVCQALVADGAAPQLEVRAAVRLPACACARQGRPRAHGGCRRPALACFVDTPMLPHSQSNETPLVLLASHRQELELALNEITPEGAAAVAAVVAAKPSLRRLNIRENELEDEGAVVVARVSLPCDGWLRVLAVGLQRRRQERRGYGVGRVGVRR